MTAFTVLLTSAGRRVGLVQCFRDAGQRLGIPVRVLAADLTPELSAACAIADAAYRLPPVLDGGYVDAVRDLSKREGVSLIVPTIDPELLPLARAAAAFSINGIRVHVSSPDFVDVARDKLKTARRLDALGIPTPKAAAWGDSAIGTADLPFPLIAKPRDGSASNGLRLIENAQDLGSLIDPLNYLLEERLVGPEYTVNMFIGASGDVEAAVPHRRLEIRGGEVAKGRTERHVQMTEVATKIAAGLSGGRGAMCFQCFLTDRGPVIFEINARFGGGYPLAHAAGARFAQWLIEEETRMPSSAADDWTDGLLMLRYDSEVFRWPDRS